MPEHDGVTLVKPARVQLLPGPGAGEPSHHLGLKARCRIAAPLACSLPAHATRSCRETGTSLYWHAMG